MFRILSAALLLVALGSASASAGSQLARSLGLTDAQAAGLTHTQLAMLHNIKNSSQLSEAEKRRRAKWILEGTVPRFSFNF